MVSREILRRGIQMTNMLPLTPPVQILKELPRKPKFSTVEHKILTKGVGGNLLAYAHSGDINTAEP